MGQNGNIILLLEICRDVDSVFACAAACTVCNAHKVRTQRRNLLFRQGGVEGVGKKKSIAVKGSAAGTKGAQRGGLGGEGMAGAPLGAGTGGIALVAVTDTVSTKTECQLNGFCARQREPLGGKAAK